MKIGVINCEICKHVEYNIQPSYDKIRSYFSKETFVSQNDSNTADIWLFICGCSNPCVDHEHLQGELGKLFVLCDQDADKAINMIEKLKINYEIK